MATTIIPTPTIRKELTRIANNCEYYMKEGNSTRFINEVGCLRGAMYIADALEITYPKMQYYDKYIKQVHELMANSPGVDGMESVEGYKLPVNIDGEGHEILLLKRLTDSGVMYDSYLKSSETEISIALDSMPVSQPYCKPEGFLTVGEIADMAIEQAHDVCGELSRLDRFQMMFDEFLDEVDSRREENRKRLEVHKQQDGEE